MDGSPLVTLQDRRVGTTLAGQYFIERLLADGGMASVYVAKQRPSDRSCAVKIVSAALARNPIVLKRLRHEAKATQTLAHPNIVEILDYGVTEDGLPFMVMELLEGGPLSEMVKRGAIEPPDALPIMVQVARALARAHDFGVIHRDLKPENIFLCSTGDVPLVKLLDFGIARSMQGPRLTAAGQIFGTAQYMAPERIDSIDAGPPADLYSLGIIFFEMLAGALPFKADDPTSFFVHHMSTSVPSLSSFGAKVPPGLETLVLSLMAKSPNDRPVDAHRVLHDLIDISHAIGVEVPADPTIEVTDTWVAPRSLAPAAIDQWARRTSIFEQMLTVAHGDRYPIQARRLLDKIKRMVNEIVGFRGEAKQQQRTLESIEAKRRDDRQQFGRAVDALGVDASRARDEARLARSRVEETSVRAETRAARVADLKRATKQADEGTPDPKPSLKLAATHRAIADELERWIAVQAELEQCETQALQCESIVSDLEYQIQELRSGLARLEQSVEGEYVEVQERIKELECTATEMENDLLQIATEFCAPLRAMPALESLFEQLETES